MIFNSPKFGEPSIESDDTLSSLYQSLNAFNKEWFINMNIKFYLKRARLRECFIFINLFYS